MPKSDLIASLEARIAEMAEELTALREELRVRVNREQALSRSLDAYKMTLQVEMERNGHSPDAFVRQADAEKTFVGPALPTSEAEAEHGKTDFIRRLIHSSPTGIGAVDIWKMTEKKYPQMRRSYLYAVLSRLVDSGQAQVKNDKYYPAQKTLGL